MAPASDLLTVLFILSTKRAGSTWLNAVLGSQSWAANLGEYFRPFLIRGHVACRLCEAEGLPECTVLHGIEAVDARDAYAFAAERMGRRVLIDASKRLEWYQPFLERADLDVRLLHLIRHPCGFIESEGRRNKNATRIGLLEEWERNNRAIEEFIAGSGRLSMTISYDDLANEPDRYFPPLCEWLGHTWEPEGLAYWDFPHHGLGGNGATSLYLRDRKVKKYVTGDDAFYEELARSPRTAADNRWRERLPATFCRSVVESPYAVAIAKRLGHEGWDAP